MPDEVNLGGGAFGTPAEGNAASAMGNSVVNSRLSVDLKMLQGLNDELNKLNDNTKKIKTNFKELIKITKDLTGDLNKAATAMGKVSGKSSSGYMDTSKGMPSAADLGAMRQMQMDSVERILAALGRGGGPGGGGPGGGGGGGGGGGRILGGLSAFANNKYVQFATQAVTAIGQTIDDRVDRNRSYALPADRLSVQLQQQYGMSQQQVMTNLRGPLRNYRLGVGGINELLSMQSRTGINARMQAGSVEGIRTLMGYGYSTGDVTNYIESMGQADTVNRMFMMTGTSLYGIGGRQKSAQQVNQELIQRLGLNNREIIQAGRQSGSVIRQRMQTAGLDQGAQDILLQYAESNVGFRERGGKGFYDPSSKADRKRMGIEGNYATQAEETERVKVDREEQMYKRQADNYSQMERNLQNVNKLLGEFEDRLRGIVGAKTSMRGFGSLLKPALGIAGAVAGFALGGGPVGAMAGYGVGSGIGSFFGDATQGTGSASPGRIASENPTTKTKNTSQLASLKPVLRDPLAKVLAARPGISIAQGYRSPDQQKQMFLSRYYRTDKQTDTYYDGSYWEKKPGVAKAAPPGLSYHEIGLAADLMFATDADRQWLQQNASKFGLDEFSRMGEPWHVQSKAYPSSRKQYEEKGAPFGTDTNAGTKYVVGTTGVVTETGPSGQSGQAMMTDAAIVQQMSISESMASFAKGGNVLNLSASMKAGRTGGSGRGGEQGSGASKTTLKDVSKNAVDVNDLARMLDRRKFKQEDIWKMLAISWRESRWDPRLHYVGPHDDSYGLFQINMKGDLGPARAKQYGITNYEELYDPKVSVKAARLIYGGGNLSHWNKRGDWKNDIPVEVMNETKRISKNLGYPTGDPSDNGYSPRISTGAKNPGPMQSMSAGSTTNNVFNVNPTINVSSTGSAPVDAARIAKEVTKILEREVRMTAVRNS